MPHRFFAPVLLPFLATLPAFAEEIEQLADDDRAKAFIAADINADRQLDSAEFAMLIDALADAGREGAIKVRRFHAYSVAFSHLDENGAGVLSIAELAAGKQLARNAAP